MSTEETTTETETEYVVYPDRIEVEYVDDSGETVALPGYLGADPSYVVGGDRFVVPGEHTPELEEQPGRFKILGVYVSPPPADETPDADPADDALSVPDFAALSRAELLDLVPAEFLDEAAKIKQKPALAEFVEAHYTTPEV